MDLNLVKKVAAVVGAVAAAVYPLLPPHTLVAQVCVALVGILGSLGLVSSGLIKVGAPAADAAAKAEVTDRAAALKELGK